MARKRNCLSSKLLLPVSTAMAVVILCVAMPSCKAQDAVQIVARAALCFDNHTVINSCLKQMGISTTGGTAPAAHGGVVSQYGSAGSLLDKLPTSPNASAVLCGTPCFGHMMLVADCVDGILSNFQGYSAGLMQGVRAVFQMSCAGAGNGPAARGALKGGGSSAAASGKEVARNASGSGATTAGAAVPAANGGAAGGPRRVGSLVWVGIIIVAARYGGLML